MTSFRAAESRSRWSRVSIVVAAAFAAGGASLLLPPNDIQSFVYDGWSLLAAAIAWVAVARLRGVDRRVAALIAAGCTAFAIGNVLWDVYEVVLERPVPEPSIADAAYLCGYPFFLGAAITVVRERTGRDVLNALTDAVILAMAIGLLVWEPVLLRATSDSWQAFVAGAYPVSDVAIIGLLVMAVSTRRRSPATWAFLIGITVDAAADFAYLVITSRHPYVSGTWPDAFFIAGPLIMAAAPFTVRGGTPFSGDRGAESPERPVASTAVVCAALVALPIDFGWALAHPTTRGDVAVRVGLRVILLALVALRLTRQSFGLNATTRSLQSANHTLERTATRLASVMESTEDAVIYVDTNGRLLEFNPAARRMFSFPDDLGQDAQITDVMPADTVARIGAAFGPDVLAKPQQVTVPYFTEGRPSQLLFRTTPVQGDETVAEGVVVIARDVTQRALQEIAALSLIELEPQAALRVFARPLREIVRFDMLSLSATERDRVREIARARIDADGTVHDAPEEHLASGSAHGLELNFAGRAAFVLRPEMLSDPGPYFRDHGLNAAILVFLRRGDSTRIDGVLTLGFADASVATHEIAQTLGVIGPIVARALANMRRYEVERSAVEELRDIDELREGFLRMVAHEVRTPLGVISFAADVLRDQADAAHLDDSVRLASGIAGGARQLDRLIGDLVDVARGKFLCAPTRIDDPSSVIRQAAVAAAGDQQARLALHIADLPPMLADRERVHQVVTNLVGNALKFSRASESVTVTAHADGNEVELCVIDKGVGIPAEQAHRLFQRFARFGARVDGHVVDGSGLGLHITHQIVTAHHGTISYRPNDEGPGSTFIVRLPQDTKPPVQ